MPQAFLGYEGCTEFPAFVDVQGTAGLATDRNLVVMRQRALSRYRIEQFGLLDRLEQIGRYPEFLTS